MNTHFDFGHIVGRVYAWFGFVTFWGGLVYGLVNVRELLAIVIAVI